MSDKAVLKTWVTEALIENDGCADLLTVSRWVWEHHEIRSEERRVGKECPV